MIAPTPFFSDRGAHVQIYEQAKALARLGNTVQILTYNLGRDVEGIIIHRCWTPKRYKKISAGPSITKIFLVPLMCLKLIKLKFQFKPHQIHAHLHEGALIAKLANQILKTPTVFDYQGSLNQEVGQYLKGRRYAALIWFLRLLEKEINSWFPVITQSEKMVYEIGGMRRKNCNLKILNVRDGVDTNRFSPTVPNKKYLTDLNLTEGYRRIIFMGYLAEHQGIYLLLDAFRILLETKKKVFLIIIGYPVSKILLNHIANLGIADHIRLLGQIDYFEVHSYLALGEIAIAPKISTTEGDGKIYNYMAMGIPVVTFEREVSREILENAGIYCPEMDSNSLAKTILDALVDTGDRGRMGRELSLQKLSWDRVGSKILSAYAVSGN